MHDPAFWEHVFGYDITLMPETIQIVKSGILVCFIFIPFNDEHHDELMV